MENLGKNGDILSDKVHSAFKSTGKKGGLGCRNGLCEKFGYETQGGRLIAAELNPGKKEKLSEGTMLRSGWLVENSPWNYPS